MQCSKELNMALGIFDEILDNLASRRRENVSATTWIDTNFSEPKYIIKSASTTDMFNNILDDIDHIIYNDPATIVTFKDGSKVCVKASKGDTFNKETGLVYAIVKRLYANDIDSDTGYFKSKGLGEKINNLVKNAVDQKEIERQRRAKQKAKKAKKEADAKAKEAKEKEKEANEAGENAAKNAVDQVYGNKEESF